MYTKYKTKTITINLSGKELLITTYQAKLQSAYDTIKKHHIIFCQGITWAQTNVFRKPVFLCIRPTKNMCSMTQIYQLFESIPILTGALPPMYLLCV